MRKAMRWCLLGMAAAVSMSGARAEVLDQAASGFTLQQKIEVPVSRERAWAALVNDVGLWWPADHTWWGDARKLSIEAIA
ncbi:MAG TPA: SRPBCC domain-containing protein, partial [Aquimonas sp.]|nr:SRPBCC domain-containing protein [Aquimonas sp.]